MLHVKDGGGDAGAVSTPLGEGVVDFDSILAAAARPLGEGVLDLDSILAAATAAEWHVVELEGFDADTVWPAVDASVRYLIDHELSSSRSA